MYRIFLFCAVLLAGNTRAQFIIKDSLPASFSLKYSLLDFPYLKDAAKSEAVRRLSRELPFNEKTILKDHGKFYRNLSMEQSAEMATALHGSLYYTHNVIWNNIIPAKNTKNYILNRLVANAAALGTDYLAIKLPYGYAFQHEEFHRSVMASRNIYSFDEIWKFGKGLDIAVTSVKDEDLIYLKKNFPADQVRLSAAGVEGEYFFMQKMRAEIFFNKNAYPFLGLSVLGTFHAINYVKLPFAARFNDITDSILSYDKENILVRDFTGYDFSAWVYDLFTPDEPYEARGEWPGGVGIKRPVKETDLTEEMKSFLKQTGNMQYINLISPFMVGINRMQLQPGVFFNFALRSVPASFGYYAGGDFFLDIHSHEFMISLGINKSNSMSLPSIDLRYNNFIKKEDSKFNSSLQFGAWLQPKDQMFFAKKPALGISMGFQPEYEVNMKFNLTANFSFKTKGWVFGNPYLDQKFIGRLGAEYNF